MNLYNVYLAEIKDRKKLGLKPKPIDDGALLSELIKLIKDSNNVHRADALKYLIYNILPGTTSAAKEKAEFLKEIILENIYVTEITPSFAFELLSHMKGGPSVKVLIDLTLGNNLKVSKDATNILKSQVFLYEADTERLKKAYSDGNAAAKDVIESYSNAEFFTKLPKIEDEIEVVTYIAAEGDISTDLLSPGNQAHSRADRELHGKCFISESAQSEIQKLQQENPNKRVMLIAEKGTMGVGSSRIQV
jgi:aconitate hydratase 2/2-methylisocitrate dehydratase